MVGYATVCRFMKDHGLARQHGRLRSRGQGDEAASVLPREKRSYELAHVNALWHYDFHVGRRQVLTASGERKTPTLFGILDDCSRVCCHAQWYEDDENAENLVHGSDQQGCDPRRSAVMITDHVPAVRVPPDHMGHRVAPAVPA